MCEIKRKAFSSKDTRNRAQSNYRSDKVQVTFTLTKEENEILLKNAEKMGLNKTAFFKVKCLKN